MFVGCGWSRVLAYHMYAAGKGAPQLQYLDSGTERKFYLLGVHLCPTILVPLYYIGHSAIEDAAISGYPLQL